MSEPTYKKFKDWFLQQDFENDGPSVTTICKQFNVTVMIAAAWSGRLAAELRVGREGS